MTDLRYLVTHVVTLIDQLLAMRDATLGKHEEEKEWQLLFDIVFGPQGKAKVDEALKQIGINDFDWFDPDTSYQEDACSYLHALEELKARLLAMFNNP